jgi:heat shock protein HtpX
MGAREVDPDEYPDLHRRIERLSQQADLPKPKVAVANTRVPNAFATGRNRKNATVAVTTGLLESLDEDELDGVLAHELAHVKNRDVMVMTIASFLSTIAFFIVRWGWLLGGDNRQGAHVIVAILVSLVVWVVSFLLIRALSRYREYSADRGAALITGKPGALASALMTIDGRMDKVPKEDLREEAEMNAFFIIPIKAGFVGKIASTHPSTENRIEKLRELEKEMETA